MHIIEVDDNLYAFLPDKMICNLPDKSAGGILSSLLAGY